MATFKEHLQKHSKRVVYHVKKHHRKYIFGVVWWAIAVKLVLTFIASVWLYEWYGTFAEEIPWNEIKQENTLENSNTFEETLEAILAETWSDPSLSNTWDNLIWEVFDLEVQTWENFTWWAETWSDLGWSTNTWDYQTWDNLIWEVLSWSTNTWESLGLENLTWWNQTGSDITWWFTQEPQDENVVCDNADFNFINPLSWSKLKWVINFSWTYSWVVDCSWENFDMYIRDHNNQWIKIWTSSYLNTRFQFNSIQLYSGFYNILSSSWNIIYTWQYSWLNSNFYTGYKIRIIDQIDNIVYTWDIFTIDNQLPEITWMVMEFTWNYNSWYIWLSWLINLNFIATEDLTWIIVNILWTNANLKSKSWLNYSYYLILSNQNSWTNITYNISFSDLAWNTWSKYLTSQVLFDKSIPILNYILFTWTYTWFNILWSWNKLTKYDFTYTLSWVQTWITLNNLNYMYSGLINITWLNKNQTYNYIFKLTDLVNNILTIWGNFFFTTWWKVWFIYEIISGNNTILNVSTWSTWKILTISNVIREEINKFNECKKEIKITNINIKIKNQDIKLNMPNFEKSYVKTLVNSFTIVIIDKLKKSNLTKKELDNIIDRFDDFLIILKLLRDDENQCKQNLSNYHIRSFQKALKEYNISIE